MALQQIIYTSHSHGIMTSDALVELLRRSQEKNARHGITGMLLHGGGSFMQTIEGEFEPVHRLFAAIEADARHSGLILLCDEPIERRSFADWSMAFREISAAEAERIPGFRLLAAMKPGDEPDRDLARHLMRSFASSADLGSRS
jgi:hypothetical protein